MPFLFLFLHGRLLAWRLPRSQALSSCPIPPPWPLSSLCASFRPGLLHPPCLFGCGPRGLHASSPGFLHYPMRCVSSSSPSWNSFWVARTEVADRVQSSVPFSFHSLNSLSPVCLPNSLGHLDAADERALTLSLPSGVLRWGRFPRVSTVPPLFLCDILGSTSPHPFCRASRHRLVSSTLRSELPRSAVVPTTCTARTPPLRTASRSSRRSARKQRAPRRTSSA